MKELIDAIIQKHWVDGIEVHPPASLLDITYFERLTGFPLPQEFKDFYLVCNGFSCTEDIFNITPLADIREYAQNYEDNWFYFSEYMISSDSWGLRLTAAGQYEIFNGSHPEKVMTSSLTEFLHRFLQGNVFEPGGLYNWHEELGIQ